MIESGLEEGSVEAQSNVSPPTSVKNDSASSTNSPSMRETKGPEKLNNGATYVGEWRDGKRDGQGILT